MMFKMLQYSKDGNSPDLLSLPEMPCYLRTLLEDMTFAHLSTFLSPRVLNSWLCNFYLNPFFLLPTDLGMLCAFLGTGALVFLMLSCILFTTLAFGII